MPRTDGRTDGAQKVDLLADGRPDGRTAGQAVLMQRLVEDGRMGTAGRGRSCIIHPQVGRWMDGWMDLAPPPPPPHSLSSAHVAPSLWNVPSHHHHHHRHHRCRPIRVGGGGGGGDPGARNEDECSVHKDIYRALGSWVCLRHPAGVQENVISPRIEMFGASAAVMVMVSGLFWRRRINLQR